MAKNAMRTISLRNIASHKIRLALTILSVVLGTAFISGSSIMTTSLQNSLDDLLSTAFDEVGVVVMPSETVPLGVSIDDVAKFRDRPDTTTVDISAKKSSVVITDKDGKPLQTGASPAQAFALAPGDGFATSAELAEGTKPTKQNEIALNEGAMKRAGLNPGDKTTVVTPVGKNEMTVTGTFTSKNITDMSVGVAFTEPDFLTHFTDGKHAQVVTMAVADGQSPESVKEKLAKDFPNYNFQTGDALAKQTTEAIKTGLSFLTYVLWAFAGIALLVGTFIISNTFAMIVAQRSRELALLRAVGASRKQITNSVVFEAIVVGLIGSVLGIFAGMGLVKVLFEILKLTGMPLPNTSLSLDVKSIVVPLAVGVIITVLSAWAPAQRAGATHPVQAMRSGDQSSSNSLVGRSLGGSILIVLGVMTTLLGTLINTVGGLGFRSSVIGTGAVLIIVGLWLAGPSLAGPLVGGLGRIAGKPFGAIGNLAATNSRRNPRRTAATAFALTLGLMMVSSIGMLGTTMRESMSDMIDDSINADFVLSGSAGSSLGVPKEVPDEVSRVDGVTSVATTLKAPMLLNEKVMSDSMGPPSMTVLRGDISQAIKITTVTGDLNLPEDEPGVLVAKSTADSFNLKVGDEVMLKSLAGGSAPAPVKGIYEQNSTVGRAMVSYASALELNDPNSIQIDSIFVNTADGQTQDMRKKLEDATASYLVVGVKDKNEFIGETTNVITQMMSILYGLLALSVIVAILGIVNTLALSVIERRQEVGMLRAVGTQRHQIRRMIYIESAVIAFYGALIGAAVGLGLGWAFIHALIGEGIDKILVPWGQVGIMLAASILVGIIAAVWPGHQAARTKPLEAITD
ncbi:FtsX-like permease family protein [Corynebacterium hindlerae]|uniref:FtsX-like permease family protein n=1 Tax=Corynebacterium hindlerae TaxID=699041 RepID=A0A7G5FBY1_9CORY|nr:FtsX-like permease family protein [Corynebacterium hindlerae]QMV84122.1 FtsX-like permease family protein [Corynebacterium hindlerae]